MLGEGKYLVRTFCATYNHEHYIKDALKGFVMQETSFPVVYSIVDDASTDGTAEVIRGFVKDNFVFQDTSVAYEKDMDYGHITFARHKTNKSCFFAVIYLKENHYSQGKSKAPYLTEWMDTKYVALCEGDDYWTDPFKLQKQVDYLEHHPDCCMCSHAANWETNGEVYPAGCQRDDSSDLSTEEVIRNGGLYLATNSLVYRAWLNDDWPEWRKVAWVGDFPLQILGTLRGKLHFFADVMSIYRFMRKDSWSSSYFSKDDSKQDRSNIGYLKNRVLWLELLDEDTYYNYTKVIHSYLFMSYNILYGEGEIGFGTYFKAAHKAGEKHYVRVFKDFLIKQGKPIYRLWKKKSE